MEIKDALYYGAVTYLGCGFTYAVASDTYRFIKAKLKERKEKKEQGLSKILDDHQPLANYNYNKIDWGHE